MKDLNTLAAAWMEEVRTAGVPVGTMRKVSWGKLRGRLGQTWNYTGNNTFRIELADFLAEDDIPEQAVRAVFCRQLVYTCPDCWEDAEPRIRWLRKIEDACGWGIFRYQNRFDLRHLKKKPLLTLHCPHCGLRWEVREKRKADLIRSYHAYNCPLCPSLIVPEGQEDTVLERDLPAIAEECRRELLSIGIPLGEVSSVRFGKMGRSFGLCYTPANAPARIEISTIYQDRRAQLADLKEVLYHEFLHTCEGCQNHGSLWRSYARRVDKELHSTVTAAKDIYDILHPDAPILGQTTCSGCGSYHDIRDPAALELYRQGGWSICYFCGARYGIKDIKFSKICAETEKSSFGDDVSTEGQQSLFPEI